VSEPVLERPRAHPGGEACWCDGWPIRPSGDCRWKTVPPIRADQGQCCERTIPVGAPPWWAGASTTPGAPVERAGGDSKRSVPPARANKSSHHPDLLRGAIPELNQINAPERSLPGQPAPAAPGRAGAGVQVQAQLRRSADGCEFQRARGLFRTRFLSGWLDEKLRDTLATGARGSAMWAVVGSSPLAFRLMLASRALETRGLTISECGGRPAASRNVLRGPAARWAMPQPRKKSRKPPSRWR